MTIRIEIANKARVPDSRGAAAASRARSFLHLPVTSCRTRDVYKLDIVLSARQAHELRRVFTDPIVAVSALGKLPPPRFDWLIEIGFKPGVTDNVGRTARLVVEDTLGRQLGKEEGVYTSVQYFLRGSHLTREDAERIAVEILANRLINTVRIFDPKEWEAAPIDLTVPRVGGEDEVVVRTWNLEVPDDDLLRISREGILSLGLDEMRAIRDYYRRSEVRTARQDVGLGALPTDVELECIAQTWSEHCKHKIFAARVHYVDEESGAEEWIGSLFGTYIRGATEKIARKADWLVSVFTDNAGVIRFNDRIYLTYKVETHNSPSALDPYGGAITGIVGCNRDPMGTGMGSELLCNTWGYCLGSPFFDGDLPEGLFHPRRIRDGVHQGVIDGGNQSGIPYARGFERFDERYIGKPLVYCGTVGILPHEIGGRPSERKEVKPGDLVVMVGGRIGKDGIHGATFSSEELRSESPPQAVQIGDPITQRMMYEFLMEARDLGLYRAITDNGAGGLSCSVGEMGLLSGGADIDLARAPLKYHGLQPWEIFLSEAQERMTLAVPPEKITAFMDLARRRDVEATVLGEFTEDTVLVVRYKEKVVGRLDMDFLYRGCPQLTLEARWRPPRVPIPRRERSGPRNRSLLEVLGSLNVCSKEFKARMYDHEVKGRTVIKPFVGVNSDVPADATVLLADYGSREGVVLAEGINPYFSDLDTYWMAASVIDEAVRRIIAAGGRLGTIAGLDNFCWPDPVESESNPDGSYKMAQLVRANKALYDVCTAYGVPCISGKDSMKNDSVRGGRRISIPPTLLFSTIARIPDIRKAMTMFFKRPGDLVYVAGLTKSELGASEYYRVLGARRGRRGEFGGRVPAVDTTTALELYRRMEGAVVEGLVHSVHTPTLGGLAVALVLPAVGGDLGVEVDLSSVPAEGRLRDDEILFSESNSRFVVSCPPENAAALEDVFRGTRLARIGRVTADRRIVVRGVSGSEVINTTTETARRAYMHTLEGL